MRDGNAGIRRSGDPCRDARNDFERNAGGRERLRLLTAAAKDERIATLEPNHPLSLAGETMNASRGSQPQKHRRVRQVRRNERTKLLERLCELRDLYALRGQDDRTSAISIDDAVRMAVAMLDAAADQTLSPQQPA